MTSCPQLLSSLPQLLMLLPAYSALYPYSKEFSDLLHLLLVLMSLHNVLGTECSSQQFFTSPAVWVPKAPNLWLTITPGISVTYGLFNQSSKEVTSFSAPLPYAPSLDTQKGLRYVEMYNL